MGISTPGESVSLERKIESSIFLCIPRDLNILGKSCTTFVIVKIVRNLSRGRSPCQRVNHVKSGVIYFSAFIFSYDTIHVSGTIHTWNRGLTGEPLLKHHVGEEIMDDLFSRFTEKVINCIMTEKWQSTNLIISLTRKDSA